MEALRASLNDFDQANNISDDIFEDEPNPAEPSITVQPILPTGKKARRHSTHP